MKHEVSSRIGLADYLGTENLQSRAVGYSPGTSVIMRKRRVYERIWNALAFLEQWLLKVKMLRL